MEEILGQSMRPPIVVKDFLSDYKKLFKYPYTLPCTDINLRDVMQLSENSERFNSIEENCSIDHLKQPNDTRVAEFLPGDTEIARTPVVNLDIRTIKLKTFNTLTKSKATKKPSIFHRTRDSYSMLKPPHVDDNNLHNIQPGEEIKLYVRFYRPCRATHIGRTLEKPVFSQEFECLGRNFLSELRDKIHCVCNNKRFFDVSENPNIALPSKESDPGYFFINDTFYNDKRNPLNMDYSQTIRNWAKKAKGLSNLTFKTALMEETRFIDLTLSLGFPQLYQHHGNCEHVFVFSNVEIITNPSKQLAPSLSCYPCILTICRYNTRTCNICGKMNYVFVVVGSNRQLHDPAYLCKQCFTSYHYVDGKKIGEFKAYRVNDEVQIAEPEDTNEIEEQNINGSLISIDEQEDYNSENAEEVNIIIKEETNLNLQEEEDVD